VGEVGHVTAFFGGVAADEPRATLAGRDALSAGGTAADAAVAMYFTMAVTLPSAAGLGGGGVCVVYDSKTNKAETLDFIARAPGRPAPDGRWTATVPGTVRGMFALHARYGRLRWETLVQPAETIARFGVPVPRALVRAIAGDGRTLLADAASRRELGGASGRGLTESDTLRRFDLAATLGRIRSAGAGDLYTGQLARHYLEGIAAMGGYVAAEDLRAFRPVWRETVEAGIGPHRVHFPTSPAVGGRIAAAIWSKLGNGPFADADAVGRARLMATAARDAYAAALARPDQQHSSAGFLAMDRNGAAVSCAVTMNRPFGTGRTVPEVGFIAVSPPADAAGANLGLVPMVVANHNTTQAFLAATGSGDGFAAVAVTAATMGAFKEKASLQQLLAAPRVGPGPDPGTVIAERSVSPAAKAAIAGLGLRVVDGPALGRVQGIFCSDGMLRSPASCIAGADPRGFGYALLAER
jgi:gamma-glutamyltranspeptidase/glutathione hydrolase